jgi:outer membrane protein W
MKSYLVLCLLGAFVASTVVPGTAAAERLANYVVVKGGVYSPSETFTVANLDLETTFEGDTETGFAGELGYGRFVLPTLALEFGVGYFRGTGSFASVPASAPRQEVDFDVIPILLTAKALIPMGAVDPYGALGIGAYFTSLNVSRHANSFEGDVTFGIHVGAGLDIHVTERVFFGAEARYVWADPSFGDETITLNDESYSLKTFELNGFTTMAVLGLGF